MRQRADYTWKDLDTTGYEEVDVEVFIRIYDASLDTPADWDIYDYEIITTDQGKQVASENTRLWHLFDLNEVGWDDLSNIEDLW